MLVEYDALWRAMRTSVVEMKTNFANGAASADSVDEIRRAQGRFEACTLVLADMDHLEAEAKKRART